MNVELISYIFIGIVFIAAVIAGTIGDYIIDSVYYNNINKQEKEKNE